MGVKQPNIILITTDQERSPQHMGGVNVDEILPTRARLRREGVSYENYYANASPCTPNRSLMLTGLYPQQTWMCSNIDQAQSALRTEFPTYAKALQEMGYYTIYHGKWHLSTEPSGWDALAAYGFNRFDPAEEFAGEPGQGSSSDPKIAGSAEAFIYGPHDKPFLSVINFVNPHDMMFYPDRVDPPDAGETYEGLTVPRNYESLARLKEGKPKCQAQYQQFMNKLMGEMPSDIRSEEDRAKYVHCLNYYLWLQDVVDAEIGKILAALDANPKVKENTIIIFTSDHGEQAGSHGMTGKQCSVYEETTNVPFYVVDYTKRLIPENQAGTTREQLASSIDLFPTLLGLAAGGDSMIPKSYAYLTGTNLTPNMADSSKPTKDKILFTYDYRMPIVVPAPDHILCLINKEWKGAVYDHWRLDHVTGEHPNTPDQAVEIAEGFTEEELYKRTSGTDRLEIENLATKYPDVMHGIKNQLYELARTTIRGKLPPQYQRVSEEAKVDYVHRQQTTIVAEIRNKISAKT